MKGRRYAATRLTAVLVTLSLAGCGGSTPTRPTPTPTPIPACERDQTATIVFENGASSSTHTVILDGVTAATLSPGQKSAPRTVTANVAHTVEFRVTNTNRLACSTSHPTWTVCSNNTLVCRGN